MNLIAKKYPLFPLPDTMLFPGQILPLNIFEPRYREMVSDLLDRPGELLIGTVLGEDKLQLNEVAPVQPIAGLGRIESYRNFDDGKLMVVLLGKRRMRIEPFESDKSYPQARAHGLDELPEESESEFLERLREALSSLGIAEKLSDPKSDMLADIILMGAKISEEERYRIYSTCPTRERVELILQLADRLIQ